eukprot:CAMPEP_0177640192 /NCGR_PEP_ID=MMETSP0447-20121125/6414_1 /TAXON_ID=0 /ORGANISM="Stygamoeba regulata, Strain BSH-02190019" /LENGTH=75 /DNA_ID=CAMNT_0019142251 /DNA_START=11 /DNA_END=238 /DNA_ORIENTATION=-
MAVVYIKMTCGSCAKLVERAFNKGKGDASSALAKAESIDIDVAGKKVTISGDVDAEAAKEYFSNNLKLAVSLQPF